LYSRASHTKNFGFSDRPVTAIGIYGRLPIQHINDGCVVVILYLLKEIIAVLDDRRKVGVIRSIGRKVADVWILSVQCIKNRESDGAEKQ
jgi:hypothetical protein